MARKNHPGRPSPADYYAVPSVDRADIPVSEYIDYLSKNKREGASRTYKTLLRGFESWLITTKGKSINDFSPNDVSEYVMTHESANTSNTTLAAIKGYLKYRAGSLEYGDPSVVMETQRINQINLIRPRRVDAKFEKTTLSPQEIKRMLVQMYYDGVDDLVISGAIVHCYFGARPIELAKFISEAKIDWDARDMVIKTAKRGASERFLSWHPNIDPHLALWYENAPFEYPSEWMTKHMNKWQSTYERSPGGIHVTARTFRRVLETQLRLSGVQDIFIDHILGHASQSSKIGDVYTDFTMFKDHIRNVFENQHYMINHNIV